MVIWRFFVGISIATIKQDIYIFFVHCSLMNMGTLLRPLLFLSLLHHCRKVLVAIWRQVWQVNWWEWVTRLRSMAVSFIIATTVIFISTILVITAWVRIIIRTMWMGHEIWTVKFFIALLKYFDTIDRSLAVLQILKLWQRC